MSETIILPKGTLLDPNIEHKDCGLFEALGLQHYTNEELEIFIQGLDRWSIIEDSPALFSFDDPEVNRALEMKMSDEEFEDFIKLRELQHRYEKTKKMVYDL